VLVTGCFVVEFAEAVPGSNGYARAATAALLACAMAVSIKLSATAFALVVGLGVATKVLVDARGVWNTMPRPVRLALAMGGAMLALVAIRGVLLSGYPAYPSTVAGLPVDWRVSDVQALLDRTIITSMARNHLTYDASELARASWMPDWAYHIALDGKFTVLFPALVAACAGLAFALRTGRIEAHATPEAGTRSRPIWPLLLLMIASGIAIAIWLLFAPAPRFGTGPFWLLASCLVLAAIERARWRWTTTAMGAVVATALIGWLFTKAPILPADRLQLLVTAGAAVAWLALVGHTGPARGLAFAGLCAGLALMEPVGRVTAALVHHRTSEAADVLWLIPDDYYTNGESVDSLVARQTHSGLTIYIPPRTHFETPLPNTRYFNPYLELRKPGRLMFGFRTRMPDGSAGPGYVLDFMANHAGGRPVPEAHARR
jgi:hypothetical protein